MQRYTIHNMTHDSHDIGLWLKLMNFSSTVIRSWSQTTIFRCDFTYPNGIQYPNDNKPLGRCLDSFRSYCKSQGLKLHYFWVREQSHNSAENTHHYHVVMFLRGSSVQNPYAYMTNVSRYWGLALGGINSDGLVHYCKHGLPSEWNQYAIKLRRADPNLVKEEEKVWNWIQYLAKLYSKDGTPYKKKSFSHTQI